MIVLRTSTVLPTTSASSCASESATAPRCFRSAKVRPAGAALRAVELGLYQMGELQARSWIAGVKPRPLGGTRPSFAAAEEVLLPVGNGGDV